MLCSDWSFAMERLVCLMLIEFCISCCVAVGDCDKIGVELSALSDSKDVGSSSLTSFMVAGDWSDYSLEPSMLRFCWLKRGILALSDCYRSWLYLMVKEPG